MANEPGVPWIVRVHGPCPNRSPIYLTGTHDEGDQIVVDLIEETVRFEGPENIAGIVLEGCSGSSGIMQGGDVFGRGVQRIFEAYDILLIVDEVMSGFGRTGEWLGIILDIVDPATTEVLGQVPRSPASDAESFTQAGGALTVSRVAQAMAAFLQQRR